MLATAQTRLDHHFSPYARHFESATRSVATAAKHYLHGLYQSARANLECMAETVRGSGYQRLHHMLSESGWDRLGVYRQLIDDANTHFSHGGTALVIDESAFAKKGTHSAGVARQWNGRLGKTDNCQVGVFAAVTRDAVATLLDAQLYLPQSWLTDPARCAAAGVPDDAREFYTKGQIALQMVLRARLHGLQFDWVCFDAGYGHLPWLLRELDEEGEVFLAEVHADQRFTRLEAHSATERLPQQAAEWAKRQPAGAWQRHKLRDGEKGEVVAEFLTCRVRVVDDRGQGRHWHLLVRRELSGGKLKCCLSNAPASTPLTQLVAMQASRHFVERAFEDAKSACGLADYQVRGWRGWHQHMSLVMMAQMFLVKERLALRHTHRLLSSKDVVEMLRHRLSQPSGDDTGLVQRIVDRHARRRTAAASAYAKQGLPLPPEFGGNVTK